MAVANTFTFGGVSTSAYGLVVEGPGDYSAPKRAVDTIEIPGRNGAFQLDKGYYENIELEYKVVVKEATQDDFLDSIDAFRNAIVSQIGYQRLEDTYHPGEYRMAMYSGGLDEDPQFHGNGAVFKVNFDCKPQRFLTSGETAITIGEWRDTETVSGDIVEVENPDEILGVKSLSVALSPIQDLHGYDKPWVGGAGKNKANIDDSENGGIDANGQNVTDANNWRSKSLIPIKSGQAYTLHAIGMAITRLYFYDANGDFISPRAVSQTDTVTATSPSNAKYVKWTIYKTGITIADVQSAKVQLEEGSTATPYSPYSNICPISGHTEVDVVVSPTTDAEDGNTYTTALGRTVYGGTVDLVSGELVVTHGYIASYNGETLPSTWISDRDEYASGTTPTIGAEVVYELATPQTYQLSPQEVALLTGTNNVWSDSGDITLEYGQLPNLLINPTLFEASPLLAVTGSGVIRIGTDPTYPTEYVITLNNDTVGEIELLPESVYDSPFSSSLSQVYRSKAFEDTPYALTDDGDTVTLPYFSVGLTLRAGGNETLDSVGVSFVGSHGISNYIGVSSSEVIDSRTIRRTFSYGEQTWTKGSGTYTTEDSVKVTCNITQTNPDTGTMSSITRTVTFKIRLRFISSGHLLVGLYEISTSPGSISKSVRFKWGRVTANSTQSVLGSPTYIDCDLGEAYKIEGGEVVSLNTHIDLGSKLPTLAVGENEITFDNTITDLKVTPRWWKV